MCNTLHIFYFVLFYFILFYFIFGVNSLNSITINIQCYISFKCTILKFSNFIHLSVLIQISNLLGQLGGSVSWVCQTLDFGLGHDLTIQGLSPVSGSVLATQEPAWDSLSLSLCPSPLSISLALKINKHFFK